ncbi:MAG: hypothetical protein RL685_5660 [Pseudomonadota bacterium]|jgi:hypothetical protein
MKRLSWALALALFAAVLAFAFAQLRSTEPLAAAERTAAGERWVTFEGACDASGAVPIDARHFAVADDEDNVIRVYDAFSGGQPVQRTNLSPQLALQRKSESDIEAATSANGKAFWLSSHARNKKGNVDPNRSLLITTELPTLEVQLELRGQVYRRLLEDLEHAPELERYDLTHAAELGPKEPGGLNLEGLTATPEGKLLIGFRSPIPGGKALIVPLLNPDDAGKNGPLRFGTPLELELSGLGVRSLSYWRGQYLIAAGPGGDGAGPRRLYRWSGPGTQPRLALEAPLRDVNPEAFFTAEDNPEILVLSDDGTRSIRGKACKKLGRKGNKRFRGLWLRLPDAGS